MSLTLSDLVRQRMGDDATVVEASQPEAPLTRLNALAIFDDVESARAAIRQVEGLASSDENLSFVSVSRGPGAGDASPDQASPDQASPDQEGVVRGSLGRVLPGALIGALAGALFVGLLTWLVSGRFGVGAVAAIGGAVLFGAIGGLIGAFSRFGDSSAYQQTFTTAVPDTCLVAIHVHDDDEVAQAVEALKQAGGRDAVVVDESGAVHREA